MFRTAATVVTAAGAMAFGVPADARVLRNDAAEPGAEIGFYPSIQGGSFFSTVLEVPADLPDYQICAVHVWIGPNDFNVFTLDVFEVDAADQIVSDVYRSDLDAYQVFGSRVAVNEIDLREQFVFSRARRLDVRLTHVEGFPGPPTIVADADGITPRRNRMSGLRRDGSFFITYTEDIDPDGPIPRPPGDWILRLLVVGEDEACPQSGAVLPDGGMIISPPDEGVAPPPAPVDAAPKPDRDATDGALPAPVDAAERDADRVPADAGEVEREAFVGSPLRLDRIAPAEGPADEITTVLVEGDGFSDDGAFVLAIGDVAAFDVTVMDDGLLTAIIPAGLPTGTFDVRAERSDGARATLPRAYTVFGDAAAGLAVTAIVPNTITEGTLQTLTLLGRGFTDDVEFFAGPLLLQGLTLQSGQRATAVMSTPLPAGTYEILARRGDERASLPAALTVVAAAAGPSGDGCRLSGLAPVPRSAVWLLVPLGVAALRRPRRRR
ncbi:hypothetical protein L6V77_09770 [Myxococcota bacterium]|nr:hypothetical protein [Myxococcota bacterium]